MWTFSSDCIPIHCQNDPVFAFVSLKRVPSSITETLGSSGLVSGCYPPSTVVDMKQELKKANVLVRFSKFKEHRAFVQCSSSGLSDRSVFKGGLTMRNSGVKK